MRHSVECQAESRTDSAVQPSSDRLSGSTADTQTSEDPHSDSPGVASTQQLHTNTHHYNGCLPGQPTLP